MLINCGKCGASVTETAIFCATCGTKLAREKALTPDISSASPLTKAASALAKASGLAKSESPSRFSLLVRGLSIAAGILLVLSAYLVYRNQTSLGTISVLNIVSPLDKFNQLVNAGKLSLEQNDIKAALSKFEEAEKEVPNNTDMLLSLAQAYYADGQVDNAVAKCSRVVELDPKNIAARVFRVGIQRDRGLLKDTFEDYQYLALNAPPEQATAARQALSKYFYHPSLDPLPTKNLGPSTRSKAGLQLPEVAELPTPLPPPLPNFTKGVPVTPPAASPSSDEHKSAGFLATQFKEKGKTYLGAQMYSSALKSLQQARNLTPDDNDLYYLLGQAHHRLKQYEIARRYYDQCNSGQYKNVASNAAQIARKEEETESKRKAKKAKKEQSSDE